MFKKIDIAGLSFAKTASVLFLITLAVKILGLFREILMAAYIGMNQSTDAYNIAILAASIITGIAGIAIGSSLIPVLASIASEKGEEEQEQFFSNVFWTLMIIAFVSAGIVYVFAVPVIKVLAPGFDEATVRLSANLFQIGFIKINAIVAAALFTQYLNYKNCFYSPMIAASIGTVVLVGYFIVVRNFANVSTLMMMTVITYVIQMLWMVPALVRNGFRLRLYWNLKDPNLISFFSLALLAVFNYLAQQIGIMVNRGLASQLTVGSISALNYANSIVMMINMTVSLSIATVIYPRLAEALSKKSMEMAIAIFRQGILLASILLLPALVGLILLAAPISAALFERGLFTADNTAMTAQALCGYSIGIIAYAFYELSSRFFYSMKDTKTPMMAAFAGVLTMIMLSFWLYKPLELLGLSLSTSAMQIVMAVILLAIINYKNEEIFNKELLVKILIVTISALTMGLVLFSVRNIIIIPPLGGVMDLTFKIIFAICVYTGSLHFFSCKNGYKT
ncbi:MAG: murein biosynthesis integral membrane protein MurJ [Candidatus Methanofastidiosum sp.]|nr:murein biosynthesis integral membrane protein MurJ [Methanofastidiosum sp.]